MAPTLLVSKRLEFAASHQLINPAWSAQKNWKVFGPDCQGPFGHGHNFVAYFAFSGPISPENGMMIELSIVKHKLQQDVLAHYDHYFLNTQPQFKTKIPTVEVIATQLFHDTTVAFSTTPITVHNVTLHESANSVARTDGTRVFRDITIGNTTIELAGELDTHTGCIVPESAIHTAVTTGQWESLPAKKWKETTGSIEIARAVNGERTITVSTHFSATHRLHVPTLSPEDNRHCFGKCTRPHGHQFDVAASFVTQSDAVGPVHDWITALIREWHYLDLTTLPELKNRPATIESIITILWDKITHANPFSFLSLSRLQIDETPNNRFTLIRT